MATKPGFEPLSSRARRALIALVLHPDAASNRTIHERFGFKIERAEREELAHGKLITCQTVEHNAYVHQLTDGGLRQGRRELEAEAPEGAKPTDRLLYATWHLLARSLPETVEQLKSFLQTPHHSLPERILAVYDELVSRPGGTITLVDLRAHLESVTPGDLNRTLVEMDRRREIQLEPDPDRAALTPQARKSAVTLGGQDMHLMRADGR
jgi:hypothetical protein